MGSWKRLQTGENDRGYSKARSVNAAGFVFILKASVSPQRNRRLWSSRLELTLRGLILGCAITLVFTAANVYLGLKVGLTFASTIPAAVISMAVLRAFKNATIYENNIVQTRRLGRRHALGDHLRVAGAGDDRLVERLSVRLFVRDLRDRRHPRRHVQRAAAARARDDSPTCPIPKASPPPKCSRWARAAGSAAERQPRRTARAGRGDDRLGGLRRYRRDAHLCRANRRVFPHRRRGDGAGFFALARARRRGSSHRPHRSASRSWRARHRVGHRDAAADGAASRGRRCRRRRDRRLVASSAFHRRRRDRRRGAMVARAGSPTGRRTASPRALAASRRRRATSGARRCRAPSGTCRSRSSASSASSA